MAIDGIGRGLPGGIGASSFGGALERPEMPGATSAPGPYTAWSGNVVISTRAPAAHLRSASTSAVSAPISGTPGSTRSRTRT